MVDLSPKPSPGKKSNPGYFSYELWDENTGSFKVLDSDHLEISSEFLESSFQVDMKKISGFKKSFLMISNHPESAVLEIKSSSLTENISYKIDSSIWSKLRAFGVVFLKERQECRFQIQNLVLFIKNIQKRSDGLKRSDSKSAGFISPINACKRSAPAEQSSSEKTPNGKTFRAIFSPMKLEEQSNQMKEVNSKRLNQSGSLRMADRIETERPVGEALSINNRLSAGNHQAAGLSQNAKDSQRGRKLVKISASSTHTNEAGMRNKQPDFNENANSLNFTSTQKSCLLKESCNSVLDFFNINLEGSMSTEPSSLPLNEQGPAMGQRSVGRVSSFFSDLVLSDPDSQKESKERIRTSPPLKKTRSDGSAKVAFKRLSEAVDDDEGFDLNGDSAEADMFKPGKAKEYRKEPLSARGKTSSFISNTQGEDFDLHRVGKKKRKLSNERETVIVNCSIDQERSRLDNLSEQSMNSRLLHPKLNDDILAERKLRRLRKKREENLKKSPRGSQDDSCAICLGEISAYFGLLPCKHRFCFPCIKDWADVTNLCPLCKRDFLAISKQKLGGGSDDEEVVKVKRKKQKTSQPTEIEEECDDFCYMCSSEENPDLLLICDKCNFYICHTYCANLRAIPEDDWYCQYCEFEEMETRRSRAPPERQRQQERRRLHPAVPVHNQTLRINTVPQRPGVSAAPRLNLENYLFPRRQNSNRSTHEFGWESEAPLRLKDDDEDLRAEDYIETFVFRR